ncbi:hypothetical protein [Paenibacillus sp. FJAT-26967]|uniref:hypothetical protein n=1 Tax=Paenibacillus sp. FJAT-26967 TaxID=1729690 RepID=UPI0008396919|nr:hypothetical protein [Paenibacillus sp. FJAT-26967]
MNRNFIRLFLLTVSLIAVIGVMGCSSQSRSEQQVKDHLTDYLKALENKDVETMVKLTDDIRFPDKEEQKNQYNSINQNIKNTSIKELKLISETEYLGMVSLIEDDKEREISFPVKKIDNQWKIIVGHTIRN